MKRITTLSEALTTGRVTVDADGLDVELFTTIPTPIVATNEHHIDDFVTPGMKWYARYDATADPVRGYPAGAYAGSGEVFDRGGPQNLLQVYYSRASAPAWRSRYNGTWGPWTSFAGGPISPPGVEVTPAYDSGLRDITSLAGDRVASGAIRLRRSGNVVTLEFREVKPSSTASSGGTLLTIPAGFRRPTRWDGYIPVTSSGAFRSMFLFAAGTFGLRSPATTDTVRLDLTWITNDPPPVTSPGDPA